MAGAATRPPFNELSHARLGPPGYMSKTRLLFVDDEPSIRTTLSAILQMHDFEVTSAGSVPEALAQIQSARFDVLLSDLNIGEAGDGFTIVSAMRRIQPHAITIIITGYPAFETALQAIRNQVDDYVLKPAKTEHLIKVIREKLAHHDSHLPPPLKKLSFILGSNLETVMDRYVEDMRAHGRFPIANLSREEILDHLPAMMEEVISMLRSRMDAPSELTEAAREHGKVRCRQGFTVPMMMEEMRILRSLLYSVIQENLLAVDVSTLIPDMISVADTLDLRLKESTQSYLADCDLPKTA